MKIKNRIIILSTVVMLVFSITVNASAAYKGFKDLDNISAKNAIVALQDKGIVKGTSEDTFSPENTITVAQTIQLFVRTFDLNLDTIRFIKEPKATDYFKNADDNAWYAQALIISSVNGLDFPPDINPNATVTREEFTYYLVTAIETHGEPPMVNMMYIEYIDADQVTAEYSNAIQTAIKCGIVSLGEDGKFNPKTELSRADAAEELYNALKYVSAQEA